MLAPTVFLGLVVALIMGSEVTNGTKPETFAHKSPTAEDLQPKRRCIPTAVTRGPCHMCVCTNMGDFLCHPEDCHFNQQAPNDKPSQQECEPGMLYMEGALWCNCNSRGFWKSSNCRANFRYIRNKKDVHPIAVPKQACENGSMYVVDCNVCDCRAGALSAAACTNRTCARAAQADPCKRGQLLRDENQLCACGAIGYKRCIILAKKDNIQKISLEDLAILSGNMSLRSFPVSLDNDGIRTLPASKCKPHTVIYRDCNRCTCSRSGKFACTSKLCIADSKEVDRSGKTLRSKHAILPELKSEREACVPGKQYRFKCNTCYCTSKGIPACTTMICLDYLNIDRGQRGEKGLINYLHNSLPIIHEGENCTQGQTYKLDCNVCHCSSKNRLICTKKLCLTNREIAKQHKFEDKFKSKKRNIIQTQDKDVYVEAFPDKLVVHQRIGNKNKVSRTNESNIKKTKEKIKTNTNKKENKVAREGTKSVEDKSNELPSKMKSKSYQELTSKKCKPGKIYTKGCQRCFCNYKKVAQCTNKSCKEMTGPVRTPTDVHPRITVKEIQQLPKLPHEAARCKPGKAYAVGCNACLCLSNGNLLCDKQLCLAVEEVNKIAAMKQTGKPCQVDPFKANKTIPEVEVECIECSCVQGNFDCAPRRDCTPLRYRRALHGEFGKSKAHLSLDAQAEKCLPGMVYKQNCNNCYCQEDETLRCTRKGCLNFQQVEKLKEQRQRLLKNSL